MQKKMKLRTIQITKIAMCAALVCVCSWIAVPSPFAEGVNFTLQTFAIILAGLVLSPIEALFTGLVYCMLGLIGLPVLSGFGNFYARIATVAGGYIIGFYITPFLVSFVKTAVMKIADKNGKNTGVHFGIYLAVAIVIGILGVDIPGVIQAKILTQGDWGTTIVTFALSFMPTDIVKCVLAAVVAQALEKPLAMIGGESANGTAKE